VITGASNYKGITPIQQAILVALLDGPLDREALHTRVEALFAKCDAPRPRLSATSLSVPLGFLEYSGRVDGGRGRPFRLVEVDGARAMLEVLKHAWAPEDAPAPPSACIYCGGSRPYAFGKLWCGDCWAVLSFVPRIARYPRLWAAVQAGVEHEKGKK